MFMPSIAEEDSETLSTPELHAKRHQDHFKSSSSTTCVFKSHIAVPQKPKVTQSDMTCNSTATQGKMSSSTGAIKKQFKPPAVRNSTYIYQSPIKKKPTGNSPAFKKPHVILVPPKKKPGEDGNTPVFKRPYLKSTSSLLANKIINKKTGLQRSKSLLGQNAPGAIKKKADPVAQIDSQPIRDIQQYFEELENEEENRRFDCAAALPTATISDILPISTLEYNHNQFEYDSEDRSSKGAVSLLENETIPDCTEYDLDEWDEDDEENESPDHTVPHASDIRDSEYDEDEWEKDEEDRRFDYASSLPVQNYPVIDFHKEFEKVEEGNGSSEGAVALLERETILEMHVTAVKSYHKELEDEEKKRSSTSPYASLNIDTIPKFSSSVDLEDEEEWEDEESAELYGQLQANMREYFFIINKLHDAYIKDIESKPWPLNTLSPRPNKKLLVLDLDHTLCDTGDGPFNNQTNIARPFLLQFLRILYTNYDIGIWSATNKQAIQKKLNNLKLYNNPNFEILFTLDYDHMITVAIPSEGLRRIKPLSLIWNRIKQYNKMNTIIVDDLLSNFYLNPSNGLLIRPYYMEDFKTDMELQKVAIYLTGIAKYCKNFSSLNHKYYANYRKH